MNFTEYQDSCRATAIYPEQGQIWGLMYVALGLAGEAGEVANKTKKVLRDEGGEIRPEYRSSVADELGDVLWYVAMMADELGLDLNYIVKQNIEKLQRRKRQGMIQGEGDR